VASTFPPFFEGGKVEATFQVAPNKVTKLGEGERS
jgi:hypothetical protein